MRKLPITLISILCLAGVCAAQNAAPVDTPELVKQREDYMRNLRRASIPLLQQYLHNLDLLSQQYARDKKWGGLAAVQSEVKKAQEELAGANNATDLSKAGGALTILSAKFGDPETKRFFDGTEFVRKALRSGKPTVDLRGATICPGIDPAPLTHKKTVITYTVNGLQREKTFPDGTVVNFKEDLQ